MLLSATRWSRRPIPTLPSQSLNCLLRRHFRRIVLRPRSERNSRIEETKLDKRRRAAELKDIARNTDYRFSGFPSTTRILEPIRTRDLGECHALLLCLKSGRSLAQDRPRPFAYQGRPLRNMLSYVQVVCTPTADTPGASVLLHFDNRRYLFGNLSEGTQRIMQQQKVSMSKLDEFFLSGPVTWKNTGGILGLMLTIADIVAMRLAPDPNASKKAVKTKALGMPVSTDLNIYGAENITQMIATARRFVFRKGVPLSLNEVAHKEGEQYMPGRRPDFEDMNVKVWFVSVKPGANGAPRGRKRSHDDMENDDKPSQKDEEENRMLVKSVVDAMFNSDWKLDALMNTTLLQVKQPAKIFLRNDAGQIVPYQGPLPEEGKDVPDIPVLVRTPWPASRIANLPSTAPSTQSLCYIVKGQSRRGKFNLEAATKLGVNRTDFKHLVAGQTVKGKDGVTVTPDMCMAEDVEGRGFAFIDLPDPSYIPMFLAKPEWTDKELTGTMEIMYWRLGSGVLQDPQLQEFMQQRSSIRHHIFSSEFGPNGLVLKDAAANIIRSHRIDPDRFPLPIYTNETQGKLPKSVAMARPGAKLQLSPRVKFDEQSILQPLQTTTALKGMDKEVIQLADEARKRASDPKFLAEIEETEKDIPNRDTEIITLGTGSAIPSKYRNVSATLIRVPGVGSYLLDCGENTLGQLRRMYGFQQADEILRDLKVIWISHLHADHHLGTASVIAAWRDAIAVSGGDLDGDNAQPRLTVVSHGNMISWIREYAEIEDIGIDRLNLVSIAGPREEGSIQIPWTPLKEVQSQTGLTSIESCRVDHCVGALACVFNWPSGLRIAYSGDCRPSKIFVRIAQKATLLIHEATLDDELIADAEAKKHSTMSEALEVARDMRARRVLLTHFSQRYPKIANAYATSSSGHPVEDQAVMVSFDMMRVKLGDFRKAGLFLPALRKLYEGGDDEEPLKTD